jgi:uncharacterized delta-60 repeat protein
MPSLPVRRHLWQAALAFAMLTAALGPRAMANPGDLDTSFAGFAGGTVEDGLCFAGMAVMPDGRIVVAGSTGTVFEVRRYLANGTLDPGFSGDGIVLANNPFALGVHATCVAVSAGGRVAVGGWMDTSPANFVVACLTGNGIVDSSFGTLGWVTTDFDQDTDAVEAIAFQPDGKVLAAGRSLISGDYDFTVARYTVFGLLDTSFSGDGKASVPFGGNDQCKSIALQSDGKILLAGGAKTVSTDFDFAFARLHTDGSLDNTFGGDGKVIVNMFGYEFALGLAIQSDGKIIASGNNQDFVDKGRVARLMPNGSLDSSFGDDGRAYDGDNSCEAVAVQPNGSIVVAGVHVSPNGDWQAAFHRLTPAGALDLSLGGGAAYIDLGSAVDRCQDVAVLLDGRILGNCEHDGLGSLLQIWPDGGPDSGGLQTVGLPDNFTQSGLLQEGVNASCLSMAVQSDGKLVLMGEVSNQAFTAKDIALTRLLPSGIIDASFGTNGRVQFGPFAFDQPRAVAIQPDGKIVIGGHMVSGTQVNFMVARLNSNGSTDGSFGFGGFNVMDFQGGDDLGAAMALAPDGRIVVAGNVWTGARFYFGVARFNSDGTPDNTFDVDGKQTYDFGGRTTSEASAVVVQPDRKIVVGGTIGGEFTLVRFNENGSVDDTFGVSGRTITHIGGIARLNALAIAPNGWFYAAGSRDVGGNLDLAVAQYFSDGTLTGCGAPPCGNWSTGMQFVDFGGTDTANSVDVRSDGRIAVAGRGNGLMVWAEFGPLSTSLTHFGLTDFPGTSEGAYAVRFTGFESVVVAGYQTFGGNSNFAAARFWATPRIIASGIDEQESAQPDGATRILAAYPNPLAGQSTITFAVPRDEFVELRIYDVAGRLVRRLAEEQLPAGQHARAWDGKDDAGRRVAAGVYFCRLHAGESVQKKSLLVLK